MPIKYISYMPNPYPKPNTKFENTFECLLHETVISTISSPA